MNSLLVGINEKKILDKNNPIGFIKDIKNNFGVLVHRSNYTVMMNIEDIDLLFDEINYQNDDIIFIEVFKSDIVNKQIIGKILYKTLSDGIVTFINKAFISTTKDYTLGYDYNMKHYFSVGIEYGEMIFRREKSRYLRKST